MPKKSSRHLFTKYGREVKSYQDLEAITSLTNETIFQIDLPETIFSVAQVNQSKISRLKDRIAVGVNQTSQKLKNEFAAMKTSKVRLFPSIWLATNTALVLLIVILIIAKLPNQHGPQSKYSVFSAKPLTLGAASARLFGGDSRAAILDSIFESYKCPLVGKGKTFVKEADKNDIPYWMVPAIAFQESSCGRSTPKVEDNETYNAWGWAVWGDNTHSFKNWDEGIKTVSQYLGDRFYSQGITDPCEIMKTYTPPSNGSWCEGINYFADIIQNYKTLE